MSHRLQFDHSRLRAFTALLLVLVLVVFASAEVIHSHSSTDPARSKTHCSLCVAAHSVASPVAVGIAPVAFNIVYLQSELQHQTLSQLSVPSAFIRPPPTSL